MPARLSATTTICKELPRGASKFCSQARDQLAGLIQLFYRPLMGTYVARDHRQLMAVASPGRDELLDAVCSIGPCTVTDLARFLGRSRNGLYYHVRALRDCGVLHESFRIRGKHKTATYDVPGRPFLIHFNLGTETSRKAVLRLASIRLRNATRAFGRACRPDIGVVDGARRNLWASDWKGWLSGADLEKANRTLLELVKLFRKVPGKPNSKRKYYVLTYALSPVVPQPSLTTANGSHRRPLRRLRHRKQTT
jgi:DNA-binding transcriptional ArsR family regulator